MFNLPKGYTPEAYSFYLTPVQEMTADRSHTHSINIKELAWRTSDHDAEFEKLWRPLQRNASWLSNGRYEKIYKDGGKSYAENLDASSFFGVKSVSFCSIKDGQGYESFVSLPQGIVNFDEYRPVGTSLTPHCTNIEGPAALLFKHYSWGKRPPAQKDTFYTALGMVTGYPAERETASLSLDSADPRINVSVQLDFDARWEYDPALDRLPSESEVRAKARSLGADFHQISRGNRTVAGRELLELITKFREHSNNPYTVTFLARSLPSEASTADKPKVLIELRCSWEIREQAMTVWNTVLGSFRHVYASER
jgi:hypothetical protein